MTNETRAGTERNGKLKKEGVASQVKSNDDTRCDFLLDDIPFLFGTYATIRSTCEPYVQ